MTGYALHPEAFRDLDEIREFIAEDNIDAAGRVIAEIFEVCASLSLSRIKVTVGQTSHPARCDSNASMIT